MRQHGILEIIMDGMMERRRNGGKGRRREWTGEQGQMRRREEGKQKCGPTSGGERIAQEENDITEGSEAEGEQPRRGREEKSRGGAERESENGSAK